MAMTAEEIASHPALARCDGLDGGGRVARFVARPAMLPAVQPLIADGLIGSGDVREPEKTFSLFTWINEGGIVMDRLMAGCGEGGDGSMRILTDVTSISGPMACGSRAPSSAASSRKPRRSEASAGQERAGARRCGCRRVFAASITPRKPAKLAIIDAAFEACV